MTDGPPSGGGRRVLLAVEQLRRRVPGGIGRYATGVLEGLAQLEADTETGVAVSLLASRARPGGPDPLASFGRPVVASRLGGPALTRAWDHRLVTAPGGFDVVHSVSLGGPARPRGGGRRPASVVTVHDVAWRRHPESTTRRGRRWHEAALRRALAGADVLVVPSDPVAADLAEAGARSDRVVVIAEGADHLAPPDAAGAARLLAERGVVGPYVLSVGTLEPRKNLPRLVEAHRLARGRLPGPWPLVLVGPAGWGTSPDARSAPPGVVLLGQVGDAVLAGLYAGAALFAYVPLVEGFGLPPLEAMAAGVPTVVSRTVPSVAPSGTAAPASRLVDPGDPDDVAAGLVEVAGDDGLAASLVAAGSARVRDLTWRRTAAHHVALWRSLR
ncbi:MAG TPA: glycosyltransferase family 1 protein [Acidimicrobiales bacterium]|nr:glycosyltransferase family 1 protein [Acidimicrobiales bacterium]